MSEKDPVRNIFVARHSLRTRTSRHRRLVQREGKSGNLCRYAMNSGHLVEEALVYIEEARLQKYSFQYNHI